jgi:hypothetical protein
MADDSSISNLDLESQQIDSASLWNNFPSQSSVTDEMRRFYALQAEHLKSRIDTLAAEIRQRQDKMRLINDIVAEINNLTDEKNGLDISQNTDLLEKLQIAKDLGVKIKDGQTKFNALERDRLIENLHLAGDNWDKENRHQTQKMEIVVKELDRIMMILKDVDRKEDQAKKPMVAGIRGGG